MPAQGGIEERAPSPARGGDEIHPSGARQEEPTPTKTPVEASPVGASVGGLIRAEAAATKEEDVAHSPATTATGEQDALPRHAPSGNPLALDVS